MKSVYIKEIGKVTDVITEFGWTKCIFDVDKLFTNNTPHTNFWTWCILNNLIYQKEDEPEKYEHLIWFTDIILSKSETLNQRAREMFEKLSIKIDFEKDKNGNIIL